LLENKLTGDFDGHFLAVSRVGGPVASAQATGKLIGQHRRRWRLQFCWINSNSNYRHKLRRKSLQPERSKRPAALIAQIEDRPFWNSS